MKMCKKHPKEPKNAANRYRCNACTAENKRVKRQADPQYSRARAAPKVDAEMRALVDATRKPIAFEDLCDKLNKSPAAVRNLLARSDDSGIGLKIGQDHIQLSGVEQIRTVQDTRILPTRGKRQQVGVISDLHLGSKYCLRTQLKDCVHYIYSLGIRDILCPGDWLDGCYRHGVFELSHTGLEDQTQDLAETLPRLKGLKYHGITGNHDETFSALTGVDVGRYIHSVRPDILFYGRCGAFIKIKGIVAELWHPLKGMGYAKTYQLQNHIRDYGAGEKPDLLLAGHWHQSAEVESRGVFARACPTFQGCGSTFSHRLGGQAALGGQIISWDVTASGLVRNFSAERRRYFEVELAQKVRR